MRPPPSTLRSCALFLLLAHPSLCTPFPVQLDAFGDHSIRVRIGQPGGAIADPPLQALLTGSAVPISRTHQLRDGAFSFSNGNLAISVNASSGLLAATRLSDGVELLRSTSLVFSAPWAPGLAPSARLVTVSFAGHGEGVEKLWGLGEHRMGAVALPSTFVRNFSESQFYEPTSHGGDVFIPWLMSSRGWGLVWNSAAYGAVALSSDGGSEWQSWAGSQLDIWVTTHSGASPPGYNELLSHYADSVGHAPMAPSFALGFIQSKDRYRNQTQLLDVARGFVQRGLPISVITIGEVDAGKWRRRGVRITLDHATIITSPHSLFLLPHLDWLHWVHSGDWTFKPLCWPDPMGMVSELRAMGIELMTTFWPHMNPNSTNFARWRSEGWLARLMGGGLPANTSVAPFDYVEYLVDSTDAAQRAAAFEAFWEGYGRFGVRAVWMDAAEPEREDRSNLCNWRFAGGTDCEVGEAWVREHVRAMGEGFASKGIGPSEFFLLPRSGWAGSWRWGAGLWSGDTQSTWQELRMQVRVLQTAMLGGLSLWSSDTGGYYCPPGQPCDPGDPSFQELWLRWLQFSAFCPLFRSHGHRNGGPPSDPDCGGTNGDSEPWTLLPEGPLLAAAAAVMRTREGLRPYLAAAQAAHAATGMPVVRPMFLAFPLDPRAAGSDVEDQFMFGAAWLLRPVTTYGDLSASVYLPRLAPGDTWVFFSNMTDVGVGGRRVRVDAPPTHIPAFYIQPADGRSLGFDAGHIWQEAGWGALMGGGQSP